MATLNTVTSSTRPASPAAGEAYFETDTNKIIVWTGSEWTEIVSDTVPSFSNTYSVDFDGSNDYVTFGSVTALNSASAFSVSVWYKKGSASDEGMIIGSGTNNPRFFLQHYSDNNLYVGFGGAYDYVSATSDTDWHHALYVFNSGTHKLYWDGAELSFILGDTPPSTTGSTLGNNFYIGKWNTYAPHFEGLVDEVSVFNSALSASQITNIYRGEDDGGSGGTDGVPGDLSTFNPVGWWRMGDDDSGTGTTITDQGSGSNDGTLTNGPTFSTDVPS
jgi:hypothetical protein